MLRIIFYLAMAMLDQIAPGPVSDRGREAEFLVTVNYHRKASVLQEGLCCWWPASGREKQYSTKINDHDLESVR